MEVEVTMTVFSRFDEIKKEEEREREKRGSTLHS